MVWIGNGEFSLDPMRLTERIDIADGRLDLRILRAGGRLPKLGALATLLALTPPVIGRPRPATRPRREPPRKRPSTLIYPDDLKGRFCDIPDTRQQCREEPKR